MLENLRAVIEEIGGRLTDVVKMTVYITDMADHEQVNETYGEFFDDNPPARVCIEARRLPDDVSVEIDAIVYIGLVFSAGNELVDGLVDSLRLFFDCFGDDIEGRFRQIAREYKWRKQAENVPVSASRPDENAVFVTVLLDALD